MKRATCGPSAVWQGIVVFVLAAAVAFGALASPSNKWRIQLGGKAKVDGEEIKILRESDILAKIV